MTRRLLVAAALMLMVAALMSPVNAQDAASLPLRIESMDTTEYPDVSMVVSVPAEMVGKELTSDAFTVAEDGDARETSATAVPTDGLQVVLLLDASGSMGGKPIVAARAAAQNFLDAMPAGVEVAVVSFADEPTVLSGFTTDKEQTAAAVSNLRLGRNTALYDGLVAGSEIFASTPNTRRTLVLLSDGGDTASVTTLEDAIISMLDAEVGFYAVELQSPEFDADALTRLGVATGGTLVSAQDPEGLSAVFVDVASQIVNQYDVSYTSEAYGRTAVVVQAEVDGLVAAGSQGVRYPDPPPVEAEPTNTVPAAAIEDATSPVALRAGTIVVLDWWQSSAALWIGAFFVFIALIVLLIFTGVGQPKKRKAIQTDTQSQSGQSKGRVLAALAEQATLLAERTLNRGDSTSGPVTKMLERAGIQLRPGEFIVLSVAAALAVAAGTLLLATPLLAVVAAVLTLLAIRLWVGRKATKRQEAFADQLVDVLQLISGSIRSGFALMQAMETVAVEIPAPAGEEFQRVKVEIQLGRDVNETLLAMAERVNSEDFKWVVEAIEIHREVGGDLAEIIESVIDTVRDRLHVRRRIHALAAEGRISVMVLSLLPFAMAAFMYLINPEYLAELTNTQVGRLLVAGGLILMAIGIIWMRRITTLKY